MVFGTQGPMVVSMPRKGPSVTRNDRCRATQWIGTESQLSATSRESNDD
jgi:hypothetical protein